MDQLVMASLIAVLRIAFSNVSVPDGQTSPESAAWNEIGPRIVSGWAAQ
jgi:hypothetical protein